MNGRLIITGAGGFLGSHVVRQLCGEGAWDIAAVTLGADEMRGRCQGLSNLKIYSEDAIFTGAVVLDREDVVLNCAYPRAMSGTDVADGLDYVESVFKAAASAGVRGIANISSQSVYDPKRKHAATEQDRPCLTDGYSVGKYCMEKLLDSVCERVPHTSIRLASLIGPGFDARVVNKLVAIALRDRRLSIEKNRQRFGYLDVRDAARGITALLCMDPKRWQPVYNMGPRGAYTLEDFADIIQRQLLDNWGIPISVETVDGDREANSELDSSLLIADIGEFRRLSMKESVDAIVRDMMKGHN